MYANGALGIAKIRRDGFVSLNAEKDGKILTKLLTFNGKKHMFVNIDGEIRVEIISEEGETLAVSTMIKTDKTCALLDFGDFDIATLNEKNIRIKFNFVGKLYSFWFSANKNGDSDGHVTSAI